MSSDLFGQLRLSESATAAKIHKLIANILHNQNLPLNPFNSKE